MANKIIDKVVSVDSIFLFQLPETSPEKCRALKKKFKPSSFTSSWVNVAANNVQFSEHLPAAAPGLSEDAMTMLEPVCEASPGSLRSLDHLAGVQHRASLRYVAEAGLTEAFQLLGRDETQGGGEATIVDTVERLAARIAGGLATNPRSWVLATGAALYWRVRGDAARALDCLRHALYHAPAPSRDTPLLALAHVMYRAGLHNDALIAANQALELSPGLVLAHFTLANIYAAKLDLEKAKLFYISTLALHNSFEPALERLTAILCDERKIT